MPRVTKARGTPKRASLSQGAPPHPPVPQAWSALQGLAPRARPFFCQRHRWRAPRADLSCRSRRRDGVSCLRCADSRAKQNQSKKSCL